MAFGMMAIVGLQTTLRQNSDIAKQRSEAVRIAEEAIEAVARVLGHRTRGVVKAYDDIAIGALADVDGRRHERHLHAEANGESTRRRAGSRSRVQVSWLDRTGQPQSVTLNSIIAAADPALSGILTMEPGGVPVRAAAGPATRASLRAAVDLGDGKSAFKPPAARWCGRLGLRQPDRRDRRRVQHGDHRAGSADRQPTCRVAATTPTACRSAASCAFPPDRRSPRPPTPRSPRARHSTWRSCSRSPAPATRARPRLLRERADLVVDDAALGALLLRHLLQHGRGAGLVGHLHADAAGLPRTGRRRAWVSPTTRPTPPRAATASAATPRDQRRRRSFRTSCTRATTPT